MTKNPLDKQHHIIYCNKCETIMGVTIGDDNEYKETRNCNCADGDVSILYEDFVVEQLLKNYVPKAEIDKRIDYYKKEINRRKPRSCPTAEEIVEELQKLRNGE